MNNYSRTTTTSTTARACWWTIVPTSSTKIAITTTTAYIWSTVALINSWSYWLITWSCWGSCIWIRSYLNFDVLIKLIIKSIFKNLKLTARIKSYWWCLISWISSLVIICIRISRSSIFIRHLILCLLIRRLWWRWKLKYFKKLIWVYFKKYNFYCFNNCSHPIAIRKVIYLNNFFFVNLCLSKLL